MLIPKIYLSKWETVIAKTDFLQNSYTRLPLFMDINDFTNLINQHFNLHMLIFYQKNDFWVKNSVFTKI